MNQKKLDHIQFYKTENATEIIVSCPNWFDEDDLACFWCNYSDQCREECADGNLNKNE